MFRTPRIQNSSAFLNLLFYLLGASVARFAPLPLSDGEACLLHEVELRFMNSSDMWCLPPEWFSKIFTQVSVYLAMPQVNEDSDEEIDGPNDVIKTNRTAGQIMLQAT